VYNQAHDGAALSEERQATDMELAVRKLIQWEWERRAAACSGRCDDSSPQDFNGTGTTGTRDDNGSL